MIAIALAQILTLTSGACIPGRLVSCSIPNCAKAYKECVYPGFGPCECWQWATTTQTVTVDGKFAVVGVWFAAPGPGSNTVYSTESQTGTTVSTTTGSGTGITVGVSGGIDFKPLVSGNVSVTYGWEWAASSTTAVDSKLTYTSTHAVPGTGTDTIDHNNDQVVLLLKPEIKFTGTFYAGQLTSVKWAIDASRGILYPVHVKYLNGTAQMPGNMAQDLAYWGGITEADFPQILAANPFATDPVGLSQPTAERFECVEQLYYQPGSANLEGYQIRTSYASTNTTTSSQDYTVKLAFEGTFLNQKLNAGNTWTWKNSTSTTNSFAEAKVLLLNLVQPSSSYTGSTILSVYVDKMFKTLMYSFVAPSTTNEYCWSQDALYALGYDEQ